MKIEKVLGTRKTKLNNNGNNKNKQQSVKDSKNQSFSDHMKRELEKRESNNADTKKIDKLKEDIEDKSEKEVIDLLRKKRELEIAKKKDKQNPYDITR